MNIHLPEVPEDPRKLDHVYGKHTGAPSLRPKWKALENDMFGKKGGISGTLWVGGFII